jgi:hypothetical protein
MRGMRNTHRILDGNPERNTLFGRIENATMNDNIKVDPTDVCGLDSFYLGHPCFSNRYLSQRQHNFKIL